MSDNPQQRLKWIAHLEFAQNSNHSRSSNRKQRDDTSDNSSGQSKKGKDRVLAWDSMVDGITRTKKLR